ncbi:MAG: pterin-4-alpha-carbinolamine dehydratase [Verrucomicrobia bacterium]|nr:pterin-4-alpha-carbinolamine dehydratase [Verrucomicrobiota bacterium]|tara:strand:- start:109 stop:345 length:237 start_codon:yes stop_codon:yes gene_type:complete
MKNWTKESNSLIACFEFKDFKQAWEFMSKVAKLAEEMHHHPDWRNVYNTVEIKLSTHDAGNIVTEKDWNLAAAINTLV